MKNPLSWDEKKSLNICNPEVYYPLILTENNLPEEGIVNSIFNERNLPTKSIS
jgi:hypothetical protein